MTTVNPQLAADHNLAGFRELASGTIVETDKTGTVIARGSFEDLFGPERGR